MAEVPVLVLEHTGKAFFHSHGESVSAFALTGSFACAACLSHWVGAFSFLFRPLRIGKYQSTKYSVLLRILYFLLGWHPRPSADPTKMLRCILV